MPTVEGREARVWIDEYVNKAGKLSGVAKMVRALVKKAVAGCEEYVNPWKIPTFDLNGPLCFYMVTKEHGIFWIYSRSDAPRSGEVAGGNGKVLAACKAAKRSGCTAIGSAGSPGTGGEAEPQGAGHWHQGPDEAKQGSRNAEERPPRHDSRLTQVPLAIQMSGYAYRPLVCGRTQRCHRM